MLLPVTWVDPALLTPGGIKKAYLGRREMDDVKVVDVCSEKRRTSTICYRVPFPDTLLSRWQIETRAAVTAEHCS